MLRICDSIKVLISLFLITSSLELYSQIPIEIEANSGVGLPHIRITEIGQDFSRITFQNTANPNKFWTIAAEPHNTGIPRVNFYYDNGTEGRDKFTITGEGRVGINNTVPQANLHVIGDVRISTLASSNAKPVYALSNGTLVAGSTIKYHSIPASAFHPSKNDNSNSWVANSTNAYIISSALSSQSLIAPLSLPHGSTIKKITVVYEDSDPAIIVDFILSYYDSAKRNCPILCQTIGHVDRIAVISSSGGMNSTSIDNLNIVIDNTTRTYNFRMGQSLDPETRGPLTIGFKIFQVLIEYVD